MTEQDPQHGIEAIYDALDGGDAERALELARLELASSGADPVLDFLAGVALCELGRPGEGQAHLGRAVDADPGDAEFRAYLARSLFQLARFDEAADEIRTALAEDPRSPEAHVVRGLLLEVDGRFDEADEAFSRAHRLDPQGFAAPAWLDADTFAARVRAAGARLPPSFREQLDTVDVAVEPTPARELVLAESPPLDPELLGLFVGVALPDRTVFAPGGDLPPQIFLFQRNLERFAAMEGDLEEQIAITLYHELGHYLGLDEDELERLDLA